MGNAKWHSITVSKEEAEVFKNFLRQEPAIIDFEPSSCYNDIHIEFLSELPFSEIIDRYLDYLRNAVQNATQTVEGNLKQYLKDNPEVLEQIIQAIREEMM